MIADFSLRARLASTAVLIALCCCASAAEKKYPWDHRPSSCFEPAAAERASDQCSAPPWADFALSKRNFDRLLVEPDYELIERAAGELGFSRARFPSGEYHFEALFLSLRSYFQFAGPRGASVANDWRRAAGPDSYAALAQALVYYGNAWAVRTNRSRRTVSPEAWELYYGQLEQANATLEGASPRLKQTGAWHALKLNIAFEHPKLSSERLKLLQAAVAAWPDYLDIYVIPMERMHPKNGGSFELVEGVAQFSLSLTRPTQGVAMYALAYERVFRSANQYTIAESNVDWMLLKEGIRDIERQRTVKPLLWKNFAQLACQVRDQAEAQHLYRLYDISLNSATGEDFDPCRAFANAKTER